MANRNIKLVLLGNGFDLAHGLKTGYQDFLKTYLFNAYTTIQTKPFYEDEFLRLQTNSIPIPSTEFDIDFNSSIGQIMKSIGEKYRVLPYFKNMFFKKLLGLVNQNGWIDIEIFYYRQLKEIFKNSSYSPEGKREMLQSLNGFFDSLTTKLIAYLTGINDGIDDKTWDLNNSRYNLVNVFKKNSSQDLLVVNFNYTDTGIKKGYFSQDECIYIHGKVSDFGKNPIVFGYGDESDPDYQSIEDAGENLYLTHMKSFGYFKTKNYRQLISALDACLSYDIHIVGHSCGLSDRVLLRTLFQNEKCMRINIFYHSKSDGSDNFREITQEISRHFSADKKDFMRARILPKDPQNKIPQIKY